MLDGLQIDPFTVLGISRDASREAVRDAYRRKSLKHHPDHGGDEWAFRIVVRAYELLTTPDEPPVIATRERPSPNTSTNGGSFSGFSAHRSRTGPSPEPEPVVDWAAEAERVRPGVRDRGYDPRRMVLVEVLWFRLEVSDIYALLDRREGSQFSGSLHLCWPDPETPPETSFTAAESATTINALAQAFDALRHHRHVVHARSQVDQDRFEGWVSFPSGHKAWSAFNRLRPDLNRRGLGVRQVTRDLTIPQADGPAT